jgi:hypothetical protein
MKPWQVWCSWIMGWIMVLLWMPAVTLALIDLIRHQEGWAGITAMLGLALLFWQRLIIVNPFGDFTYLRKLNATQRRQVKALWLFGLLGPVFYVQLALSHLLRQLGFNTYFAVSMTIIICSIAGMVCMILYFSKIGSMDAVPFWRWPRKPLLSPSNHSNGAPHAV